MSADRAKRRIARAFYDSRLDRWLNGWLETATGNGPVRSDLLGEDEYGTLLMPSRSRENWWDRKFNPRNPLHWPCWLRSRRACNVVMVETP